MSDEGRKVALLVAAGDAIGAGVARRFAAGGYRVVIVRRDASKSQRLIDELAAEGLEASAMSADVRDEAVVQQVFDNVERLFGPIEVCLFNGGANIARPLLETTQKIFFRAWEFACYAGFLTGREAARRMIPRGRGTILFTGATASLRGGKNFAAFSSAKFGLRAVAQAMARELGPNNIHVAHLVVDGAVDSPEIHRRMIERGVDVSALKPDSLTKTSSIAEAYWYVHAQTRDAWTHELDLRPSVEVW